MLENDIFLLVENSADDVALAQIYWDKAKIANPIYAVRTAEGAFDYLSGVGQYANRKSFPLPTVVLLDLKLPGRDGFHVLEWARAHASLRAILFIVLTGLEKISDVRRSYELGAVSYLQKPFDSERVTELVNVLRSVRKKRGS